MDPFTQRMLRRAKLWQKQQLMPTSFNFPDRKKVIVAIFSEEEQCSSYNVFKQAPILSKDNNVGNTRPQTNMFSFCDASYSAGTTTEADKSLLPNDALNPPTGTKDIQHYKTCTTTPQQCKQILFSKERGTLAGSEDTIPCYTVSETGVTPNSELNSSSKKLILSNPRTLSYVRDSVSNINDLELNLMRKKNCNKNIGMPEEGSNLSCYKNGSEVLYHNLKEEQQFLHHMKHSDAQVVVNEIPKVFKSKNGTNIRFGKEVLLAEEVCEIEDAKEDINEVHRLTPPLCMQETSWQAHKHPTAEEQETHIQFQNLYEEIEKQDILRKQCSKAVAACKSLKEFSSSLEYLEAARFLLIFSLKQEAAEQEMRHLKSAPVENHSAVFGTLNVETISFPLSEHFLRSIQHDNYEHWFVCVGVHSANVVATQASTCIQEGKICFTQSLCFKNLLHSFSVRLMLFYMRLKKNKFSHEEKYHIPKEKKHRKFSITLRRSRNSLCLIGEHASDIQNTLAFKLIATKTLRVSDVENAFYVDKILIPNIIEGNMYLQPYMDIALNIRHTGFLDVMEEHKELPFWERYWCRLSGYIFSYWKYPSDEDVKDPEGNVDLRTSCLNKVEPVDWHICPRPRTLLLVTGREPLKQDCDSILIVCKPEVTLIRNLWSSASLQELTQWCTQINNVLSTLEEWHLLKPGPLNQEAPISTIL